MYLEQIIAYNFRNYSDLNIIFNKKKPLNIIHSPNGMGKSNLLEIIYYLSYIRPFRNVLDKELINYESDFFCIEGIFKNNSLTNNIKIKYHKKKEIFFNDKKVEKYSDAFGKLLTVLFCSEDIFIISGSPAIKRKFFDIFLSTVDINYLFLLKTYQNTIKQKNYILKNKGKMDLLNIYNIQISKIIILLQKQRQNLIDNINKNFDENYQKIGFFKDKVKIIYCPSIRAKIEKEEDVLNFLEENKTNEMNLGYSIYGPHRDNYLFLIRGVPFFKYASFGQTRLAALVLKMIQAQFYKNKFDKNPILLLDDVILELDKEKQKNFINEISDSNQIFLTVTNREYIELFKNKNEINEIEIFYGKTR